MILTTSDVAEAATLLRPPCKTLAIEEGSGDTESMKKVKTGVAIAYIHAMILIFINNKNDVYKMCLPVDILIEIISIPDGLSN
jgi:hypothetical protein